jgi:hypothetical protein
VFAQVNAFVSSLPLADIREAGFQHADAGDPPTTILTDTILTEP